MAGIDTSTATRLVEAMLVTTTEVPREAEARVTRVDEDGMPWVAIAGSDEETPANGSVISEANVGQQVRVSVQGGKLSIVGNATSPSVGGTYVQNVVDPVSRLAEAAMYEAERAHAAADVAEGEAQRATTAADAAQASADEATVAANDAKAAANDANTAAADAANAAVEASGLADEALTAARGAQDAADDAKGSAAAAQQSADAASESATAALNQLSVMEDVVGTVEWAAEHASYELTADTAIDPDKTYYTRSGEGTEESPYEWAPVTTPDVAQIGTYYERSITDTLQQYVTSHLALTDRGLWVTTDDSGYRILITSDGVQVMDPSGSVVSTFGESIEFASEKPQRIGSDTAYVQFVPSGNPDVADSIYISGANITMGDNKALTDLFAELSARDAELDAAIADANSARDDLAELVDENNEALSQRIDVTNGNITTAVAASEEALRGDITTLSGTVSSNKTETDTAIKGVSDNLDALSEKVGTFFDFGEEGLTIGKRANDFSLLLENDKITFLQIDDMGEQQTLAYASGSAFHAPTMVVEDELQMADWSWVPRSNRNLALKWTGETSGGE